MEFLTILDREAQCRKKKENLDKSDLEERDDINYNFFMSPDGIENLILLDWIFGISFAEICYVHMKRMQQKDRKYAEQIIECLSEIRCCNVRNELADMILQDKSFAMLNKVEFEKLLNGLGNVVKMVNTVYSASLHQACVMFRENVVAEDKVIWGEVILKNGYGVYVPLYHNYSKMVFSDICHEKGIVNIPMEEKCNQGDIESKSPIKMVQEIEEYFDFMDTVPLGVTAEQVKEINLERSRENEKRGMFKVAKTSNELYIKIQSIIVKQYLVGNFPTFAK